VIQEWACFQQHEKISLCTASFESQAFYFGRMFDEQAWARKMMTIDDTPRALHTRYM